MKNKVLMNTNDAENTVNPWNTLPLDVIHVIAMHLDSSTYATSQNIVNLGSTCKFFQDWLNAYNRNSESVAKRETFKLMANDNFSDALDYAKELRKTEVYKKLRESAKYSRQMSGHEIVLYALITTDIHQLLPYRKDLSNMILSIENSLTEKNIDYHKHHAIHRHMQNHDDKTLLAIYSSLKLIEKYINYYAAALYCDEKYPLTEKSTFEKLHSNDILEAESDLYPYLKNILELAEKRLLSNNEDKIESACDLLSPKLYAMLNLMPFRYSNLSGARMFGQITEDRWNMELVDARYINMEKAKIHGIGFIHVNQTLLSATGLASQNMKLHEPALLKDIPAFIAKLTPQQKYEWEMLIAMLCIEDLNTANPNVRPQVVKLIQTLLGPDYPLFTKTKGDKFLLFNLNSKETATPRMVLEQHLKNTSGPVDKALAKFKSFFS